MDVSESRRIDFPPFRRVEAALLRMGRYAWLCGLLMLPGVVCGAGGYSDCPCVSHTAAGKWFNLVNSTTVTVSGVARIKLNTTKTVPRNFGDQCKAWDDSTGEQRPLLDALPDFSLP